MRRVFLGLSIVAMIGSITLMSGCARMIEPAPARDTTAPTVSFTVPANAATGVAINIKIAATFSKVMDSTTINTGTFTLMQGTTAVPGAVTYVGKVATFKPTSNLANSTAYTAKITTGAKDLSGNALAVQKTWTFVTGSSTDTTAPTIIGTINANGDTGVPINTNVGATFSEAMDPATLNAATFTLKQGTTVIAGDYSYSGVNVIFKPTSNLTPNTTYTATITTGAQDLAGNAMAADYVWSWTTGAVADTTAPTITLVNPADLATDVAVQSSVAATFSKAMDASTINTATFTLTDGITPVVGDVSYLNNVAIFKPTSDLAPNTVYIATITTDVKDITGNAMAATKTWSFKILAGTTIPAGPLAVNLGSASHYAILAKTTITNTGALTTVVGDIGVSPAAASLITGFALVPVGPSDTFTTSPYVTGNVYASDFAPPTPNDLTTSIHDMEAAFTDAAGRSTAPVTELGAGNIGGMTLAPGLYKWTTGLLIPTDIYLQGGANDTWIFQIAQNLTLSTGITVHLTGGAQAKNVFWQISGLTTLHTGSTMNGNMICQTQLILDTGVTLKGRLLAQSQVTLAGDDHISLP